MATLEDIVVNLRINATKFNRGLEGARKSLNKFSSSVRSAGRGLTAGLTVPIGILGAVMLKTTASFESLNAEFQVMLGSVKEGEAFFKGLTKFAESTPFELEGLSQASKLLLSYNIEGKKILPTLRMLGDVAGADQQKLIGLARAFGQTASAGKLNGQDLNQMINVGFNPLGVIAKKTGQSMADLRKQMEKGKISIEQVGEAFKIATSEGGLFFQNTLKQSKTLGGLFSTLKDNIFQTLAVLGDEFVKAFNFREVISNLTEQFAQMRARLREIAEENPELIKIGFIIAGIAAAIGPVLLVLAGIIKAVAILVTTFQGLIAILVGVKIALLALAAHPIFLIGTALGVAIVAAVKFGQAIAANSELGAAFAATMRVSFEKIRFGFKIVVTAINASWEAMVIKLQSAFGNFLATVNKGIAALPFTDGSKALDGFSKSLVKAADGALTVREQLSLLRQEHEANVLAIQDEVIAQKMLNDEINKGFLSKEQQAIAPKASLPGIPSLEDSGGGPSKAFQKTGLTIEELRKKIDSLTLSAGSLTAQIREEREALTLLEEALPRLPQRHQEITEAIELQKKKIAELEAQNNKSFINMAEHTKKWGERLGDTLHKGSLDFGSFAQSMVSDIAKIFLQKGATSLLGGIFGGAGGSTGGGLLGGGGGGGGFFGSLFGGKFANGGVLGGGKVGLVGERGPELIMPASAQRIVPMGQGGGGGGGSMVVNVNTSVDARGADAGVDQRIETILAQRQPQIVSRAVKQSIQTMRLDLNRGGQLARETGRFRG